MPARRRSVASTSPGRRRAKSCCVLHWFRPGIPGTRRPASHPSASRVPGTASSRPERRRTATSRASQGSTHACGSPRSARCGPNRVQTSTSRPSDRQPRQSPSPAPRSCRRSGGAGCFGSTTRPGLGRISSPTAAGSAVHACRRASPPQRPRCLRRAATSARPGSPRACRRRQRRAERDGARSWMETRSGG